MNLTTTATRDPPPPGAFASNPGGYRFQYPDLDPVLDRLWIPPLSADRAAKASDLAGLLIVAAARDDHGYVQNGPAAAFDLLNRSRDNGGCPVQLNLAFLLSTDVQNPHDDAVVEEFTKAQAVLSEAIPPRCTSWPISSHSGPSGI